MNVTLPRPWPGKSSNLRLTPRFAVLRQVHRSQAAFSVYALLALWRTGCLSFEIAMESKK